MTAALERDVERSTVAALSELASADRRDWDASMQHVLLVVARVLAVERVSFWELQDEPGRGRTLVREMGYDGAVGVFARGPEFPAPERADYLDALRKLAPLAIPDARGDPRMRPARAYLEARRIASLLECPVWCGGEVGGVLSAEQVGTPRRWSPSDECFAVGAAVAASAALEARARTRAQEQSRRLAFLERASRALSESLDVDEVARRAVALAVPVLADGARIALCDGTRARTAAVAFRTAEGRTRIEDALREPEGWHEASPIARIITAYHNPILVPDIRLDAFVAVFQRSFPGALDTFHDLGIHSGLWAPLFVGEQLVGFLALYATRRLGADDLDRAQELAQHVSSALANARLHRRVQEALQLREEFIALAGHELRTPLTALELTAEDLARRATDPRTARCAGIILKQARRLERLASQMLDAACFASGKCLACRLAPTDLSVVVRDAAEAFGALLESRGCKLVLQADAPVVGRWDAAQLDELVSSLLDNAAKFGAGKPVAVTVSQVDGSAELTVSDQGAGIPPDRVAHVFERFERAVPASHYGGLGLGLFLAKAIAEAHGGALSVDNRPGEGVTFTARLPMAPPAEAGTDGRDGA